MVKFIIRRMISDTKSGHSEESFETLYISIPVLEQLLADDKSSKDSIDSRELIGIEIVIDEIIYH